MVTTCHKGGKHGRKTETNEQSKKGISKLKGSTSKINILYILFLQFNKMM
jgi:hypothetical protein